MSDLDVMQQELWTASTILEWEMGDIWGHVASHAPDDDQIHKGGKRAWVWT